MQKRCRCTRICFTMFACVACTYSLHIPIYICVETAYEKCQVIAPTFIYHSSHIVYMYTTSLMLALELSAIVVEQSQVMCTATDRRHGERTRNVKHNLRFERRANDRHELGVYLHGKCCWHRMETIYVCADK